MTIAALRQPVYDPRTYTAEPTAANADHAVQASVSGFAAFPEDAYCAATLQGVITVWTPAAERLSGYPPRDVIGRAFSVLIPRDLDADVSEIFERVSAGASVALPFAIFPRKDGARLQVAARLGPLRDDSGTITGVGVIFRDIAEEFCAWEAKSRAIRMRALEGVAGGVAAELAHIASAFGAGAHGVRSGSPEDGLAQVQGATARLRTLRRDLSAFAGRQQLHPRRVAVDHLLGTMRRVLEAAAGPDIELDLLLGAPGATVHADAAQLGQAVMHLVGNARDLMAGRGRLIVESTVEENQWPSTAKPRVCTVIRVTETASGLDVRLRKRVFEPFVASTPGGSGLALAAAHGIVRQSGGHVTAESVPGQGTTYTIYLPTDHGPQERTPPRGSHIFPG